MRPLLKSILLKTDNRSTSMTATLAAISQYLQTQKNTGQRLSLLTLLIASILTPLQAQAALPQEIETALARAHLSTADISIIITPVGDKNASRLPAAIQVIDSTRTVNQAQPSSSDNINTEDDNSKQKPQQNSQSSKPLANYQSPLVTIEKQIIKQHDRQLHAYTDDPYTYQSLESIPSLLSENALTAANHSVDRGDNEDNEDNEEDENE